MLLHKFQYLPGDRGVGTNVPAVHLPVAQLSQLRIRGWHDADSDFRCLVQIWTVEGDSRHWPPPHSLPGFLAQALKESILDHHMAATFALTMVFAIRWDSVPKKGELIYFLEGLGTKVANAGTWRGLLVGDISQPRGGPMITGHDSHQVGLDADIWLTPM